MNTIVIGWLNTDIIASGVQKIPGPGGLAPGREVNISPGGKPRNIANMIALLQGGGVAMVGRTAKDPYGLWKPPVDALNDAGVNTDYITITEFSDSQKMPGIALITVDKAGNNQIIPTPGASDDLSPEDVDAARDLFEEVSRHKGTLVLTMECPIGAAARAVSIANELGIKVMFDPGGVEPDSDISRILDLDLFMMKPNEHEAKILTGIDVTDLRTAEQAAGVLQRQGVQNIMITAGEVGAYLITKDVAKHIPVQKIYIDGPRDETGCGDQAMAALCAFIQEGKSIEEAAKLAVLAGTLQFHKPGIQPITRDDIENAVHST